MCLYHFPTQSECIASLCGGFYHFPQPLMLLTCSTMYANCQESIDFQQLIFFWDNKWLFSYVMTPMSVLVFILSFAEVSIVSMVFA